MHLTSAAKRRTARKAVKTGPSSSPASQVGQPVERVQERYKHYRLVTCPAVPQSHPQGAHMSARPTLCGLCMQKSPQNMNCTHDFEYARSSMCHILLTDIPLGCDDGQSQCEHVPGDGRGERLAPHTWHAHQIDPGLRCTGTAKVVNVEPPLLPDNSKPYWAMRSQGN